MVIYHLEGGKDVCMDEQFGQSRLCVCVEDLCNVGHRNVGFERWTLLAGTVVLMGLGQIFRFR